MRRGIVLGLGLAVLPACNLYVGSGDDGIDAAIVPWVFDAQPAVDAPDDSMCSADIACPGAMPGRVTVCGRLYDMALDGQILAASPLVLACDEGGAADGPCQLQIRFYDALDFAGNPTGATPLVPQTYRQDDCGRFVAANMTRPSLGYLGIGVDDAASQPDTHRLTGVAFPVTSGQVINRVAAYTITSATDAAWTSGAGLTGQSIIDRGAVLTLFSDGAGDPVPGVRVTSNGSTRPADDFYFSDASPTSRTTVDPAMATTGVNGASLMLGSSLVEHSGTGGETTGCSWSSSLAAAIPGVLFVQRTDLENSTTGAPCEP